MKFILQLNAFWLDLATEVTAEKRKRERKVLHGCCCRICSGLPSREQGLSHNVLSFKPA